MPFYEAGVFIVTAAGNNYRKPSDTPDRVSSTAPHVVTACGAMTRTTVPYADLGFERMAGKNGPLQKNRTPRGFRDLPPTCTGRASAAAKSSEMSMALDGPPATPQTAARPHMDPGE